jgi:GH35 family endo-1,4-beta-xylanase
LFTPSWIDFNSQQGWPALETYIKDVVGTFANDTRVLAWDMWNEPDNQPNSTAILLPMAFDWARSVNPIQPLTTPLWKDEFVGNDNYSTIEQLQINNSDVISFHR